MARRSAARPLLAVAAVSLAACGSTALPAQISPDPAAAPSPTAATVSGATAGAVAPVEATPRVMPDGRPACGNVAMRAPPCEPQ
jgi:hypothetical protein